jgi:hypothetical protein
MKTKIAIFSILFIQTIFGGTAFCDEPNSLRELKEEWLRRREEIENDDELKAKYKASFEKLMEKRREKDKVLQKEQFKEYKKKRKEIKGKWKMLLVERIEDADRIEIKPPLHANKKEGKVLHVIEGNDKVKGFLDLVDISEWRSTTRCGCTGQGMLVFYKGKERLASLSYHHNQSLRWYDGPWTDDARLTKKSQSELPKWFESEGFKRFEQEHQRDTALRWEYQRSRMRIPAVLLALLIGLGLLVFRPLTKLNLSFKWFELIGGVILLVISIYGFIVHFLFR